MSEEEKEAIESLRGKEISIEINWTPKQKAIFEKAVGIKEFRENCIKVDILIKLIDKLQKELDKKDKVIDCLVSEIIRSIYYYENYHNCEFDYDITEKISKTQENIKQYFYKKVEKEND